MKFLDYIKHYPQRTMEIVDDDYDDPGLGSLKLMYIGSFSVNGEDQSSRAENVRTQLENMRDVAKSKPVLLVISLSGIKVCSCNGQSVYMAHALKRISYATCDPEFCQFSFLAREPKGQVNVQYCHAFITKSPEQAEELNTIIGNAFKMAYATERRKQPTFNELIEKQVQQQKEKYQIYQEKQQMELDKRLSKISTSGVETKVRERREMRRQQSEEWEKERENQRIVGKNKIWAKHLVGKAKHKSPLDRNSEIGGVRNGSPLNGSPSNSPRNSYADGGRSTESPPPLLQQLNYDTPPPQTMPNSSLQDPYITAIKETMSRHAGRQFGSPVTALKETIDSHFNGVQGSVQRSDPDNYLYPVMHRTSAEIQQHTVYRTPNPNLANRPLPATPPPEDVAPRLNQGQTSQGQRSSPQGWKQDEVDGHYRVPTNGHSIHGGSHTTPRYQNDSPFRYGNQDAPDGMYQDGGAPPLPLRYDSLNKLQAAEGEDEGVLQQAPWYQAGIPREIALEILAQEGIGSFIVRDSTTHPGCFALSVKVPKFDNPSGISHYLIIRTPHGFKLKGLDKEWPSLTSLVIHHTVMPEMLPCTLKLPRNTSNPTYNEQEKEDKEEDPDYQKLSDFSSMMAELKM